MSQGPLPCVGRHNLSRHHISFHHWTILLEPDPKLSFGTNRTHHAYTRPGWRFLPILEGFLTGVPSLRLLLVQVADGTRSCIFFSMCTARVLFGCYSFVLLFWRGLRDLSSLTRDGTRPMTVCWPSRTFLTTGPTASAFPKT